MLIYKASETFTFEHSDFEIMEAARTGRAVSSHSELKAVLFPSGPSSYAQSPY